MTEDDFKAFGLELAKLVDAMPGAKEFTKSQVNTWFDDLKDLELEQISSALRKYRQEATQPFLPSIGQIRAMILGAPEDRAVKAWERLLQAIRHYGPYASVDFQDPAMHTTIEGMGGWPMMANMPEDPEALGHKRHWFLQSYRAYDRSLPGPARKYLLGMSEIENADSRGKWERGHGYVDQIVEISADGTRSVSKTPALLPPAEDLKPLPVADARKMIQDLVKAKGLEGIPTAKEAVGTARRERLDEEMRRRAE